MSSSTPVKLNSLEIPHIKDANANRHQHHKAQAKKGSSDIIPSSRIPPTLFLHGLDSSSHTWRHTLTSLLDEHGYTKAVALDLRGCGYSPLGNPGDFCPDSIVSDIHAFVSSHHLFFNDDKIIPFVLVGHSMGGRIAMSFAARYPQYVKALVIEDMDVRTRPMEMNAFRSKSNDRDATVNFDRNLDVCEGQEDKVMELFRREGYGDDQVGKWLHEGRVQLERVPGNDVTGSGSGDDNGYRYYSQVNPAFRLLCYEQFFITNHGETVWTELAQQSKYRFPIHVMVADAKMTVCDEESLWMMKRVMKEGKGNKFMALHRYEGATHSIHNSAKKAFLRDLKMILRAASLDGSPPSPSRI